MKVALPAYADNFCLCRHILNWLRDGAVPLLDHAESHELLREAEYFQLRVRLKSLYLASAKERVSSPLVAIHVIRNFEWKLHPRIPDTKAEPRTAIYKTCLSRSRS